MSSNSNSREGGGRDREMEIDYDDSRPPMTEDREGDWWIEPTGLPPGRSAIVVHLYTARGGRILGNAELDR